MLGRFLLNDKKMPSRKEIAVFLREMTVVHRTSFILPRSLADAREDTSYLAVTGKRTKVMASKLTCCTSRNVSSRAIARDLGSVLHSDPSLTLLMNHVVKCLKLINYTFKTRWFIAGSVAKFGRCPREDTLRQRRWERNVVVTCHVCRAFHATELHAFLRFIPLFYAAFGGDIED